MLKKYLQSVIIFEKYYLNDITEIRQCQFKILSFQDGIYFSIEI